jgi:hypothetical protein
MPKSWSWALCPWSWTSSLMLTASCLLQAPTGGGLATAACQPPLGHRGRPPPRHAPREIHLRSWPRMRSGGLLFKDGNGSTR